MEKGLPNDAEDQLCRVWNVAVAKLNAIVRNLVEPAHESGRQHVAIGLIERAFVRDRPRMNLRLLVVTMTKAIGTRLGLLLGRICCLMNSIR
jgi:hypothetical protein